MVHKCVQVLLSVTTATKAPYLEELLSYQLYGLMAVHILHRNPPPPLPSSLLPPLTCCRAPRVRASSSLVATSSSSSRVNASCCLKPLSFFSTSILFSLVTSSWLLPRSRCNCRGERGGGKSMFNEKLYGKGRQHSGFDKNFEHSQLLTVRCYEAEPCTILIHLRCPFRCYPFLKSFFGLPKVEPWFSA